MQRILRHSDPAFTTEVYGHLDLDDMRKGPNQLDFQTTKATEAPALAAGGEPPPLGAGWLLEGSAGKTKALEPRCKSAKLQGFRMVGETGFEPATPWSRTKAKGRPGVTVVHNPS